jgi:drug/metabolite transporter (DMT)-like permease
MASREWGAGSSTLFALMVLAWAGNYLFVRIGEAYVAPLWLAALRAGVGAAGVGAYLAVRPRTGTFSWADRRDALLLGVPNTAVFLGLWFIAAPAVPPGQTAVIVYTYPLWVAVFSPSVLGGRLGRWQWGAVALGFAGVVLVSQPWASGSARPPIVPLAELLLAAVCWAATTVTFQRRFAPTALAQANGYQLLGGATALIAASFLLRSAVVPSAAPALWISVVWLGLFGTAFAYGVWFFLLGSVHASVLSTYSFLVPLVALVLSVAFEGERLEAIQVAGVALVLMGIYVVGRHPLSRSRGPVLPFARG